MPILKLRLATSIKLAVLFIVVLFAFFILANLHYVLHILGHSADYKNAADRGEKNFEQATKLYDSFDSFSIALLNLGSSGEGKSDAAHPVSSPNILQTNLDWAEALYRNRKYEKAIGAYTRFFDRQNKYHIVAMCSMANQYNGTYLGPRSERHMIDSALKVFDSSSNTKVLTDAFAALNTSPLSGNSSFLSLHELIPYQMETYIAEGKKEKARQLADLELQALKDYLSVPGKSLEGNAKAYPDLLERVKTANKASELYTIPEGDGAGDAKEAESAYWSKEYENAAGKYIELLTKYPSYELNIFKDGSFAPPIARHLAISCLKVFEQNENEGTKLLKNLGPLSDAYFEQGDEEPLLYPIEEQAEAYFYLGDFKKANQLFSILNELAISQRDKGYSNAYCDYSQSYLSKISLLEKKQ